MFVPSTTKRSKSDDKKAVMVWIHGFLPVVPLGGGSVSTLGSSTEYPGHVLAAFNEVIVVTFNYRLGILGFFNEPGTNVKGNYGMYDQVNIGFALHAYTRLNMKYSRLSDRSTSKFKPFSRKIIISGLLYLTKYGHEKTQNRGFYIAS